jgi:hypothetical protein
VLEAGVVEVRAARALQQVAADGGHVAQLRRRAGQQRLAQQRIARATSAWLATSVLRAIAPMRTPPSARRLDDVGQRQPADVDQQQRLHDAALGQVDQVGAAAEEVRAGRAPPRRTASSTACARARTRTGVMRRPPAAPRCAARDDVGVGAAAAQVAAHALADLVVVSGVAPCRRTSA